MRLLDITKKTFVFGKKDILYFIAFTLGGAILGTIIMLLIGKFDDTITCYLRVGAPMGLAIMLIFLAIGEIIGEGYDFNLVVQCGIPRKLYLPAKYLFLCGEILICTAVAFIYNVFEELLLSRIFQGMDGVAVLDMEPKFVATYFAILFFAPMLFLFFAGFTIHFGMKVMWVFWALWMIGCMMLTKIGNAVAHAPNSVLGKFGTEIEKFFTGIADITPGEILICTLIGLAILGVGNFLLYRKQQVTM